MDVEFLKEEIKASKLCIEVHEEFIKKTKQSIADYLCPFVVGQKIIDKSGEIVAVHEVRFCGWSRSGYDIRIKKFKKDGQPRMYPSDCYNVGDYKLVDSEEK